MTKFTKRSFYPLSASLPILVALLTCLLPQTAHAQLIAYEGFDYVVGGASDALVEVGGGALGTTGTGWVANDGWYDPVGNGASPTSILVQDVPTDWGYKDSQGNRLLSSGKVLNTVGWDKASREYDLSGVDPNLLWPAGGAFPEREGKFGAGGAELWVSFLGEGLEIQAASQLRIGGGSAADGFANRIALGRPYWLREDGTSNDQSNPQLRNNVWGVNTFLPPPDATYAVAGGATGTSHGMPVFYDEKVFFVARFEFFEFGEEALTVWINPDLGNTEPLEADASILDFITQDFVTNAIQFSGNANTYLDEVRIGLTYGDVAPIAVGQDGDFDGDLDVDGADFLEWQRTLGDATNLGLWEANFGTVPAVSAVVGVPEPTSIALFGLALLVGSSLGRNHRRFE